MAMQGSGSMTVVLDACFVPASRCFDPAAPGRGGAMYGLPYPAYVAGETIGFALGVCGRFHHELGRYAQSKQRQFGGGLGERGAFQYAFGAGRLQLDALRAGSIEVLEAADRQLATAGELQRSEQTRLIAAAAFCAESATNVVRDLFRFAGGEALLATSPLQRLFRDAQAIAHHGVATTTWIDTYGRQSLGLDG